MKSFFAGSISGFLATAPMTAAMALMHRQLPGHEQYPLPPRHITAEMAERAGVRRHLDESEEQAITWVSHFGYGAAAGAIYGPLAARLPGPPALKGCLFGLLLWTVSYLSLMPATGLFPHASEEAPRRNGLMILAHVVWGISLGIATAAMSDNER